MLPRPPLRTTCTPGTRRSRSVTLEGCRRSMSARVNTVVSAVACWRDSAWRPEVTTRAGIFSCWSKSPGSAARARLGARATASARGESFIEESSKVIGQTFEEGRKQRRAGRRATDGAALRNTCRIRRGRSPGCRPLARLPGESPVAVGQGGRPRPAVDYRCGGSAGLAPMERPASRLTQARPAHPDGMQNAAHLTGWRRRKQSRGALRRRPGRAGAGALQPASRAMASRAIWPSFVGGDHPDAALAVGAAQAGGAAMDGLGGVGRGVEGEPQPAQAFEDHARTVALRSPIPAVNTRWSTPPAWAARAATSRAAR